MHVPGVLDKCADGSETTAAAANSLLQSWQILFHPRTILMDDVLQPPPNHVEEVIGCWLVE
jgi:hypothetical protein